MNSSSAVAGRTGPSAWTWGAMLLTFVLCWSVAFPLAKMGMRDAPPLKFLVLRFLLAGGLMLAWAVMRDGVKVWPRGRDLALVLLIGLFNNAFYLGLTWPGMQHLSSGLASVIVSTNPVLVALAASLVLGECMSWQRAAGLLLCVAGVTWIVWRRIGGPNDSLLGLVLVIAGTLALVGGTIAYKYWQPKANLLVSNGMQVGFSGLLLLPVAWTVEAGQPIHWTPNFLWSMALMVGLVSMAAYLLWLHLLRTRSATEASALHFLMPPTGLLMSWAMLGEPLHASDMLGIIPVAWGIWLVTRTRTA